MTINLKPELTKPEVFRIWIIIDNTVSLSIKKKKLRRRNLKFPNSKLCKVPKFLNCTNNEDSKSSNSLLVQRQMKKLDLKEHFKI